MFKLTSLNIFNKINFAQVINESNMFSLYSIKLEIHCDTIQHAKPFKFKPISKCKR